MAENDLNKWGQGRQKSFRGEKRLRAWFSGQGSGNTEVRGVPATDWGHGDDERENLGALGGGGWVPRFPAAMTLVI